MRISYMLSMSPLLQSLWKVRSTKYMNLHKNDLCISGISIPNCLSFWSLGTITMSSPSIRGRSSSSIPLSAQGSIWSYSFSKMNCRKASLRVAGSRGNSHGTGLLARRQADEGCWWRFWLVGTWAMNDLEALLFNKLLQP